MTAVNIIMVLLYLYASGENPSKDVVISTLFIDLVFICNTLLIWSKG